MGCAYTFEKFDIRWDMLDGISQETGDGYLFERLLVDIIRFISLGFGAIKCLRIRHRWLICTRVRFRLSLFFLILRINVVLNDIWYIFDDRALVTWMILVWISLAFVTPKA